MEGETTVILLPSLLERLPIVSKTLAVCALNAEAATLTREGLVFPLVVYVSEPDATQEGGVRVTDILEHDTYCSSRAECCPTDDVARSLSLPLSTRSTLAPPRRLASSTQPSGFFPSE